MAESDFIVTADFLRDHPRHCKPHLVILGAGASIQSFPNGDARGRVLPTMNNLIDVVGIRDLATSLGFQSSDGNFEAFYGRFLTDKVTNKIQDDVESRIRSYFLDLQIPDHPTLYDHLLLSLRGKDLIATFNWDPLIFDCWERLRYKYGPDIIPSIAYLHGNVRVGYCLQHKKYGGINRRCDVCRQKLTPSTLLFPIEKKDYDQDPFISDAWNRLRFGVENALTVTVFGYGAPVSDAAAMQVMKQAWVGKRQRQFETMYFVDTKPRSEIEDTWKDFIFSHHYRVVPDFYQTSLPQYARRSVEALMESTLEGRMVENLPIPRSGSWSELDAWFRNLRVAEKLIEKDS
jgi:hypothetical protein